MATRLEIATLYSATFNRAADADGLNYWIDDGTDNTTNLTDLTDLAAAMTQSPEYISLYNGLDRTATIEAMYHNLFNRAPDAEGLDYWANGDGSSVPVNQMIVALIDGAQDSEAGNDLTTMTNKGEAGLQYADAGLNNVAEATTIMQSITDDSATVTDALQMQDAYIQTETVAAAFEFTEDWLNGQTLYDADEYLDNGTIVTEEFTLSFTDTSFNAADGISTDYTMNFDYNIEEGGIIHFTDTEDGGRENYIKATQIIYDADGQIEAIALAWEDTLAQALMATADSNTTDLEYFITDPADISRYEDMMQSSLQETSDTQTNDVETVGVPQESETTNETPA